MPELAEPFDGPKGLLVVDLEEPCAAALVTLVHVGTVAERLSVGRDLRPRASRTVPVHTGRTGRTVAGGRFDGDRDHVPWWTGRDVPADRRDQADPVRDRGDGARRRRRRSRPVPLGPD